ncbi:hypothetical protein HN680_01710, partial [Candidatus Peregrinibacteria bacterium]|nr:hypothetical protein [Candidatus Peregrinibacteria bacterium]
ILIGLDQVYEDAQKIVNGNFEDPVFNFESADSPNIQSENEAITLQVAAAKYLGDYQNGWSVKHHRSQKAKLDHFIAFMGDGDLASGEKITVIELKFDGKTLLIADAETIETTRHKNMPHNEATGLLKFRNLPGFIDNISREHTVIVYGEHVRDYEILAEVLGLQVKIF